MGEGGGGVLLPHTTQTAQQHATSVNTTTTALQPSIPEKQVGGELRSNKLIKLTKLDTATGRQGLGTSHNLSSSTTTSANKTTTTQQRSTESQKVCIKKQIERYKLRGRFKKKKKKKKQRGVLKKKKKKKKKS